MTNLEVARELLEGLDMRREARIEARNFGEWQTELNEIARILHYLIDHIEKSERWEPDLKPECWADDVDAYY